MDFSAIAGNKGCSEIQLPLWMFSESSYGKRRHLDNSLDLQSSVGELNSFGMLTIVVTVLWL
jgi:hypothetical protein